MAQKKDEKTGKWYYYGTRIKNGKRVQYKKRGFSSQKKAIMAEAKFLEQCEQEVVNQEKILFEVLVDKYLEFFENRMKETSYLKDKAMLKKWTERFGNKYVQDLTRIELQDFIDECDNQYKKRYVEKIYYTGNKVFKFGIRHEYIEKNPLIHVERNLRLNEIEEEMKFWEKEDFDKFIQVVKEPMWKCFFSTLFYMGVRKGEAMALNWNDIDFDKKTMDINKTTSIKLRTKANKCSAPKTKNSYRIITIPDVLLNLLKEWKSIEESYPYFDESNSFVFGNQLPLAEETIRRYFDKHIEETNKLYRKDEQIPRIRIHDLRHSHASYLINNMNAGFTDFDVAKRLGDTVATLHDTYAHWFKRKDENIVKFINEDDKKTEENHESDLEKLKLILQRMGIDFKNIK